MICGMTSRAVTTYGLTNQVDGRAWWGLAEGQTKGDMEAPNRGKVHSLNDHRPALKAGGESRWRRVRDHRMRTRVLTFTMRKWSGPCRLSTMSRPPNSDLYLKRLTVPLFDMSTMLHYIIVPLALCVSANDRKGTGSSISPHSIRHVLAATFIERSHHRDQQCTTPENVLLAFRNTRFQPGIRIRNVTNRWPADHNIRRLKVPHRGREGKGNNIIDNFVLGLLSAKRSARTTSFNSQLHPTSPTTTRRQRRERNGPRLFGLGTEAFGFTAAFSLGCRATHTPLSAPRLAIRSSPPHRYYVLQSRIVVLSRYQLSIRSTSHLRHLPFSTFQVSRLLPSCSEYLTRSVESRYTSATYTSALKGVGVGARREVDATHPAHGSDARSTEESHSALGNGYTDRGLVPPVSAFLQPGKQPE